MNHKLAVLRLKLAGIDERIEILHEELREKLKQRAECEKELEEQDK